MLERFVVQLTEDQAAAAYAGVNLVGSAIYQAVAFMCLAAGTPVGVAIAVTWISGSVLNTFIYANATRALLVSTLAPAAAAALIGSWLAYGWSWSAAIIPA